MTLPFLSPFYLWIKAFHVIADIAWMVGLLYLPRLFVYHCDAAPGSESSERFKVMERRLLKQITIPAMLAAWSFGILLVLTPGAVNWHAGWWHTKLLSAVLLSGVTGAMGKYRRAFAEDRNTKSQKFFRILNEVPTVLLIVIVVMAIVQPF
jgi:putative membrane protein